MSRLRNSLHAADRALVFTAMRALLVAGLLLLPRPSDACSAPYLSIFELFERADTVAYVQVRSVPEPQPGSRNPHGAGAVALSVKRTIKGAKTNMLTSHENNTSCRIGFRRGRAAVVFVDKRGHTIGQQGYREDFAKWQKTLDAWAAATDVERRGMLVAAIVGDDKFLGHDATQFLLDEPRFLVKLDKDQLAQLAKTEIVNKRLAPNKFEKETDPNKLADVIDAVKREHDETGAAAMERCERVHAKRLSSWRFYSSGVATHFWKTLAKACRTGEPVRF